MYNDYIYNKIDIIRNGVYINQYKVDNNIS